MAKDIIIYNEPITVICIDASHSIKLIKGGTYLANSIRTYSSDRKIYLKNINYYSAKYFTTIDGKSLDDTPDFTVKITISLDTDNKDYTGQFVRCLSSSGKVLKQDEIYYVENQIRTQRIGHNNVIFYDTKLKIRGVRNCVSPYRFNEIDITQQRNIKLKNLEGKKAITGDQTRKFLLYSEKEKVRILFDSLTKVLFDINRIENDINLDISKLMIIKGKNYSLIEEDVIPFLKIVKLILKPYEL